RPVLDTYGMVNSKYQIGIKADTMSIASMAGILKALVQKAGVTTKRCFISFPNSAVFTSVISMPKMSERELASAVEFEAKKYVPLALADVDLSWTIIADSLAGSKVAPQGQESLKVLLTAV